ncbi:MAG: hypothetical protein ACOYJK_09995 [Prevotella sp.]|jgi:hypothetical protein
MKRKSNFLIFLYVVLLSLVSLGIYAYTTSPLYKEPCSGDSAIFQTIGKGWAEGVLPYVGLWDLKGPIIFFINCLGYLLTGSRTGIFLIEVLLFSITLFILYRLLQKSFSVTHSCLLLFLPVISFSANNIGGNCVEEYLLPLLALSFLLLYQWLYNVETDGMTTHPAPYAFVYGMVLSFSFLTRLTNALGICGAVAVIGFWLMAKGEWRNLGVNILYFAAGFAALFVPFAAYFAYHDAFGEMWYGTFLYNLDYADASGSDLHSLTGVARAIVHFADTWLLLGTAVLMFVFRSKRRLAATVWLMVSSFTILWLLRGYGFSHYGIISLPCICISILELKNLYIEKETKIRRATYFLIVVFYTMIIISSCAYSYKLFTSLYLDNINLKECRNFLKGIPEDYKDSFIAYNCTHDIYIYNDIRPYYRFFTLQDFESKNSPSLQAKLKEEFNGNVKWILVKGEAREINQILRNSYRVYKQEKDNQLTLYKRNN